MFSFFALYLSSGGRVECRQWMQFLAFSLIRTWLRQLQAPQRSSEDRLVLNFHTTISLSINPFSCLQDDGSSASRKVQRSDIRNESLVLATETVRMRPVHLIISEALENRNGSCYSYLHLQHPSSLFHRSKSDADVVCRDAFFGPRGRLCRVYVRLRRPRQVGAHSALTHY